MKNTWIRVGAFLLGLLLVCLSLHELMLFGLRRIDDGAFGVWRKAMTGQINAQVLICGSSRAREHYDPLIIGPALGKTAFNIGRDGTLPDLQLAFLRAYLRHNRKPELIIQNLDLTSLSCSSGVYNPGLYLPYLHEPDIYAALRTVKPSIWKARFIPLFGFNDDDMRFTAVQALGGLLGIRPKDDQPFGFLPMERRWNHDFERFAMQYAAGATTTIEPAAVQVLSNLAELCHANGIKLIFVYSPEYCESYRYFRNRGEVFSIYRQLATKNGIAFFDFSDTEITRDAENFYNSQHLNAHGARLFSNQLAKVLKDDPLVGLESVSFSGSTSSYVPEKRTGRPNAL
jgi:hypothetical protein